jgi:hypothetical protein
MVALTVIGWNKGQLPPFAQYKDVQGSHNNGHLVIFPVCCARFPGQHT